MAMKDSLLAEFDHEMATTRKTLERIPDDKLDWSPHKKSWSMRQLSTHIANLPVWTTHTVNMDSFDLNPPNSEPPVRPAPASSTKEALERFDKNADAARNAIANSSDEHLRKPWTLLNRGQTVFTMSRAAVLRSFVIKHIVHHRGQMTIYLRLNDVPVPAIYGPSADES